MKKKIKVLLVDDSITACEIISGILTKDPDITVVGIAKNGREAIELTDKLKPDLITMDIVMPVMGGIEAIKYIMAHFPTPIIVLSQSAYSQGDDYVFKPLEYGALEILEKPDLREEKLFPKIAEKLIKDVKLLSRVPVITHIMEKSIIANNALNITNNRKTFKIIVFASSTGGPTALMTILKEFPKSLNAGILIVQHISKGFVEGLAEWLNKQCEMHVKVAEEGDEIQKGVAYIAPHGDHMTVDYTGKICLVREAAVGNIRPSADVLFYSVAKHYGSDTIGVILTGMGEDGAKGLKAIKRAKGETIVQDEKSCYVYGMPRAAVEIGAADKIFPLDMIAKEILNLL